MAKPVTEAKLKVVSIDGARVVISTEGTRPSPGAKLTQHKVDWGDGSDPIDAFGPPPKTLDYTYATKGSFTIRLFVVDTLSEPAEQSVSATISAAENPVVPSPFGTTHKQGDPPIIDNQKKLWTIKERQIYVDGVLDGGFGDMLLWHDDSRLYSQVISVNGPNDPDNGWWRKTGTGWEKVPGDPRIIPDPNPNPNPGMSEFGKIILPGSGEIIDEKGARWSLRASDGRVMKNGGELDGYSAAQKLLWWSNLKVYADAGGYGWYVESANEQTFEPSSDPRVVTPPVDPTPNPPQPPSNGEFQPVGGWIVPEEWAGGRIAIDWDKLDLYVLGHDQLQHVWKFKLPNAPGTGAPSNWPRLEGGVMIPKFWEDVEGSGTYANGLAFFDGKLWAAPKVMYAASPVQGNGPLFLTSPDGSRRDFPMLSRQKFAGFVKRAGQKPFFGAGAYASGQGSCSGPTLATMEGERLLEYGWPSVPGTNMEFWNDRAPRDPNYWVEGHGDSWVGWEPRMINGVKTGRWASDMICGGGLLLPEGLKYWPLMGIGELRYAYQSYGFAAEGNIRTYEYNYDPNALTGPLKGFRSYQMVGMGLVLGQEISPDGNTMYIAQRWTAGGNYCAIAVYKRAA